MSDVNDVAAAIIAEFQRQYPGESITTLKLQKLVYYSQAWHLVWDEEPLFSERIEAWANGPVVRELYRVHRGDFKVSKWSEGRISNLTKSQKETIDAVLKG